MSAISCQISRSATFQEIREMNSRTSPSQTVERRIRALVSSLSADPATLCEREVSSAVSMQGVAIALLDRQEDYVALLAIDGDAHRALAAAGDFIGEAELHQIYADPARRRESGLGGDAGVADLHRSGIRDRDYRSRRRRKA